MNTGDPGRATRREVLGGLGVGALGLGGGAVGASGRGGPAVGPRAAILLAMVGGPSPRETFDPLPDAPGEYRGPFGSIATAVPGVRVVEHLPEVARRMGRLALIRSVSHDAPPNHEAGLRLLLTGRADRGAVPLGSLVARDLGARGGVPPFVVLPGPVGHAGGPERFDRSLGTLGAPFEPFIGGRDDPARVLDRARTWADRAATLGLAGAGDSPAGRDLRADRRAGDARFGDSDFGRDCRLAARLVAAGARLVVVNMAGGVFGRPSWDAHGRGPFGTFDDYSRHLLPAFDRGFAGLLDDLGGRGLLDSTLVVAAGEFGRTPRINESGGRDHWPAVGCALAAGGGAPAGCVIGASTRDGRPGDRPVPLADLAATVAVAAGLDPRHAGLAGRDVLPELLG